MLTAAITVAGTIVVALVGAIAGRMDVNDRRKRLRQDVDLVKDMPEGGSRRLLESHIEWSVRRIIATDKSREVAIRRAWDRFWVTLAGGTAIVSVWLTHSYGLGIFGGLVVVVGAFAAFQLFGTVWERVEGVVARRRARRESPEAAPENWTTPPLPWPRWSGGVDCPWARNPLRPTSEPVAPMWS